MTQKRVNRPRKKGGRVLAPIEDSIDASMKQLEDCIKKCSKRVNTVKRNNTDNPMINRRATRIQTSEEKTVWIFQAIIKRNLTHEDWDMDKKKDLNLFQ